MKTKTRNDFVDDDIGWKMRRTLLRLWSIQVSCIILLYWYIFYVVLNALKSAVSSIRALILAPMAIKCTNKKILWKCPHKKSSLWFISLLFCLHFAAVLPDVCSACSAYVHSSHSIFGKCRTGHFYKKLSELYLYNGFTAYIFKTAIICITIGLTCCLNNKSISRI